jgi:hypothetical protein
MAAASLKPVWKKPEQAGCQLHPPHQAGRTPASLSSCYAAFPIFRAVIMHRRFNGEQRAVVERIDIQDAPYALAFAQCHCHVNAAPSANDLFRGLEAKSISLKLLRLRCGQCDARIRITQRSRIVFPAKRALACSERLLTGRPAQFQFDSDSAAVALAEVPHLTLAFVSNISARHHLTTRIS